MEGGDPAPPGQRGQAPGEQAAQATALPAVLDHDRDLAHVRIGGVPRVAGHGHHLTLGKRRERLPPAVVNFEQAPHLRPVGVGDRAQEAAVDGLG